MRILPTPDPIERFLHPEEKPLALDRMDPQERGLRVRYFLVCRSMDIPDPLGWHIALSLPKTELWEAIDLWPDDRLERAIADGNRRRALGIPRPEVFTG